MAFEIIINRNRNVVNFNEITDAVFIKTLRGADGILFKGAKFTKCYEGLNDMVTWRCQNRQCQARLKTRHQSTKVVWYGGHADCPVIF